MTNGKLTDEELEWWEKFLEASTDVYSHSAILNINSGYLRDLTATGTFGGLTDAELRAISSHAQEVRIAYNNIGNALSEIELKVKEL